MDWDFRWWIVFMALVTGGGIIGGIFADRGNERVKIEAIKAGLVQDERGHWVKPVEPQPESVKP